MKQEYLHYNTMTGDVTDNNGTLVSTLMGYIPVEVKENTGELVLNLVKQGISADEIIKLKNSDLL
tara:strand:- start:4769 stop:4963 length:195 start_codon:yes stop_codon:yes gene_type:complete